MRSRVFFWRLALSLGALLIVFSGGSIKASAALSGGKYLTTQETLDMFGRQITGRYYNGTEYVDTIFYYNTTDTVGEVYADYNYSGDLVARGTTGLIYIATNININTNPSYITFDLKPEISLLNTSQIHGLIGLSGGGSISNTVYSPPRWEWVINGQSTVYQAQGGAGPSYPQYWPSFQSFRQYYYSFVRADYSSNAAISGYSLRASFYGNSVSSGDYLLFIACPYVSSDATGQNGTLPAVTTSSPSSTTVINVDVDMTETNSLLGDILGGISGLIDGIKGLFVPSQEDLVNWRNDVVDMLEDTFTGVPQLEETMIDTIEDLINVNSVSVLEFPGIAPPGADGRPIQIVGARDVSLKPNGFNDLFDFVRLAINIAATIAVFNMIQHRLKGILVGEKVVETDGD